MREIDFLKRTVFYNKFINNLLEVLVEGKSGHLTHFFKGVSSNYIPVFLRNADDLENTIVDVHIEKLNKDNAVFGTVNIVFTDDENLRRINQEYLDRDYYTDIITFDMSDDNSVSADLFISIDRVRENANQLGQEYEQELRRVMLHGVLHVLGQDDQTEKEMAEMRNKEDFFLSLYPPET